MKEICEKCGLYKEGCINPHISGDGSENPDILFVGEAPGAEEDIKKTPFVGKSGRYLRKIVDEIYNNRETRYSNIVRCKPPNNKLSKKLWIECCSPEIFEEIEKYKPKVVMALGAKASDVLGITFNSVHPIQKNGTNYLSAYHPSYILNYGGDFEIFIRQLRIGLDCLTGQKELEVKEELDYKLLDTKEKVLEFVDYVLENKDKPLSVDIETSPLQPYSKNSKILMVTFSLKEGEVFCIPWEHSESTLDYDFVKNVLSNILSERENIICHNGLFDRKWLRYKGVEVKPVFFDTMLAHYLLYPDKHFNRLKQVVGKYVPHMAGYENMLDDWWNSEETIKKYGRVPVSKRDYAVVPLTILNEYGMYDADVTLRIYYTLKEKLGSLGNVLDNLLLEAVVLVEDMENNGCKVDMKYYENLVEIFDSKLKDVMDEIYELDDIKRYIEDKKAKELLEKGEKFKLQEDSEYLNLNSPKQLKDVLYDYCGLVPVRRTPKGQPSTDEMSLKMLKNKHKFPALLLEHRKYMTLNKMFVKPLPELIYSDGLIHPNFNLHGTETGRLSSDKPNFQQLPIGEYIRKLYVSRFDGGFIASSDFSQVEMRVMACESLDPTLINIFKSGEDLHTETAVGIFGGGAENITKEQRVIAKNVGFGIMYGRGAKSLTRDIGGTEQQAKGYIKRWFDRFPDVKKWRTKTFREIETTRQYTTRFGRKRNWSELAHLNKDDEDDNRKIYGILNEGTNFPIQSQASDMMLISSMLVNEEMKNRNLKSCIIGLIHDACIFDIFPSEEEEIIKLSKLYMEDLWNKGTNCPEWIDRSWIIVPVVVDVEMGRSLGELQEIC